MTSWKRDLDIGRSPPTLRVTGLRKVHRDSAGLTVLQSELHAGAAGSQISWETSWPGSIFSFQHVKGLNPSDGQGQ